MSIIYGNTKPKYIELIPDWVNIATDIILAGTPVSAAGTVANNANAVAIAPNDIGRVPGHRAESFIVSGVVDLAAAQAASGLTLSDACKRALDEITFIKSDGTVDTTSSPAPAGAATTTTPGLVKMLANQAASTATTVAGLKDDLNTLLAAMKTAGLMEADPPEPPEEE